MKFKDSMRGFAIAIAFTLPFLLSGCNSHPGSESQLKEDVDSFSNAYYNWQFEKAAPYVFDSSQKWLHYAASQVHQEDVDLLKAQKEGASVEINDITYHEDSTADVLITVANFLSMDTIGKPAHPIQEAKFKLHMKFENENWKI